MTTDKNDGKNVQMTGRLSPFMEPGHVGWLHGMDRDGTMYRDYKIPAPDMQAGDVFVRTLIDIRNHTILHVANVCRNKNECSGSFVTYVYTREGLFIHRVPATEEIMNSVNRRIMAESLRARGDREIPRLDIDTDNISLDELLKHVDKTSPTYLTTLGGLTMKQGEYGPLDHHPGLVRETAERTRDGVYVVGDTAKRIMLDRDAMGLFKMFKDAGMTLDEAGVITGITDPKEKVEAVEKWLREHGGMDRINEASLSQVLFGPAPGSQEQARAADLETARRLCKPVIIDDVNYGRLAVSHLGGIPFMGDVDDLGEMGLPTLYISKTPKFVRDIKLFANWKDGKQENSVVLFALEKEDLNELGMLLSKRGLWVDANFMAANLKTWVNGVVTREWTSPDEFFACQPEWIEQAKF